jgi:hypothetical protein
MPKDLSDLPTKHTNALALPEQLIEHWFAWACVTVSLS